MTATLGRVVEPVDGVWAARLEVSRAAVALEQKSLRVMDISTTLGGRVSRDVAHEVASRN